MAEGTGTKDDPWRLKTPPNSSDYTMYKDEKDGRAILVCTVGKTVLHYDERCLDELHAFLKKQDDWVATRHVNDNGVALQWSAPTNTGGMPITGYEIGVFNQPTFSFGNWTRLIGSDTTSTTDNLCSANEACYYAVVAETAAGDGPTSNVAGV